MPQVWLGTLRPTLHGLHNPALWGIAPLSGSHLSEQKWSLGQHTMYPVTLFFFFSVAGIAAKEDQLADLHPLSAAEQCQILIIMLIVVSACVNQIM